MSDKADIELEVFNRSGKQDYVDLKGFDDEIEFINFEKTSISFTDRIRNITQISNRELLLVTTIFFALFVVCEVIGGLAANSLSLLGDAGAMTIDVCSYGFNFFAEHVKSKEATGVKNSMLNDCIIEIVIPGVSVLSLLAVTGWVCSDAILRLLGHKEEDVNVTFLYSFAGANLVVDVVCTWLFYVRRQDVFLQPSKAEHVQKNPELDGDTSMGMYDIDDVEIVLCADYNESDHGESHGDGRDSKDNEVKTKNLNMISAFTHVGGDTLRSFTVLLAAMISSTFDIDATLTDALAAIVVSVTIVVAVMPLMYSLGMHIIEYKRKFFTVKTKENYTGLKTESEDESSSHPLVRQEEGLHGIMSSHTSGSEKEDIKYNIDSKNVSGDIPSLKVESPKNSSEGKPTPSEQENVFDDEEEDEITL